MTYQASVETFDGSYPELAPLYARHYAEMSERLAKDGFHVSAFNPRLEEYSRASKNGGLVTFVLRHEGAAVGYSNVYVTHDMHNFDLIAQEDTIYVLPEHRHGSGRMLINFAHQELRKRGVLRVHVTTMTDLRVSKLLERLGYRHAAHAMVCEL